MARWATRRGLPGIKLVVSDAKRALTRRFQGFCALTPATLPGSFRRQPAGSCPEERAAPRLGLHRTPARLGSELRLLRSKFRVCRSLRGRATQHVRRWHLSPYAGAHNLCGPEQPNAGNPERIMIDATHLKATAPRRACLKGDVPRRIRRTKGGLTPSCTPSATVTDGRSSCSCRRAR